MPIEDTAHAATKELVFSLGLFAASRYFELSKKMHVVVFAALAYTRSPTLTKHLQCSPWAYGVANAVKAYVDLTLVVGTARLMTQFRSLGGLRKTATVLGGAASTVWIFLRGFDVWAAHKLGTADANELANSIARMIDFGCFRSTAGRNERRVFDRIRLLKMATLITTEGPVI